MTRKILIGGLILLILPVLLFLLQSTTINTDLVKNEFSVRLPDCELISIVDHGERHHEYWDVTYKNSKGEIITAFWQVRDAGLFTKDIQVVMVPSKKQ